MVEPLHGLACSLGFWTFLRSQRIKLETLSSLTTFLVQIWALVLLGSKRLLNILSCWESGEHGMLAEDFPSVEQFMEHDMVKREHDVLVKPVHWPWLWLWPCWLWGYFRYSRFWLDWSFDGCRHLSYERRFRVRRYQLCATCKVIFPHCTFGSKAPRTAYWFDNLIL